jgi:signal transduction histidine kinase
MTNDLAGVLSVNFAQPLKILIVEDSPVDARLLEAMINKEIRPDILRVTGSLAGALECLARDEFDAVILDLNVTDSRGEDTVLRLVENRPAVAVVVNTSFQDEESGIRALGLGAQDFLVKGGYDARALRKAVYFAIERKRLNTRLAQAGEELKRAQDRLVEAERMKIAGGLATGVAHEIKNPLSVILYGVTYLEKTLRDKDDTVNYVLDNIREALGRADMIVKDLLDFVSVSRLSKKNTGLAELAGKVVGMLRLQLEEKKISVRISLQDAPAVFVDPDRVIQVLLNVTLNAWHATPPGGQIIFRAAALGPREAASLVPGTSPGEWPAPFYVVLRVDDTGTGIPADKLGEVFDPFFTTRRSAGGIGMGLAVCRNIMESHRGRIVLANRPEGGARASLFFPVDDAGEADGRRPSGGEDKQVNEEKCA